MKKYLKYLLAFLIPIAIFCICLAINNIAPLGKYLITIYDSRVQYPGFFMSLKNMHFFMFNVGLGFNFYGMMAYYLMNPLNLLIKFFDIYSYNTFYFLIIILKIGLCGLSMQFFLSREKKHDNLWSVIFSIIYALMGYVASYYYNVFWLDGVIMLPLILIGINKLVSQKSSMFYVITLAISLMINFYTGYMNCIFSVIYFIYKLVELNKYKNKKIIINFIISSLIAVLIAGVVLVPTFFALMAGKASGFQDTFTKYFAFNDNIKYLFYSFTSGNFHSSLVGNDGFAQNFCTLFVISLFITSFFNKKIDIKTKCITIIIILFYMLSYCFNLVDYAWQFFQKPIWWQHRYSFTFSAFLIIVAYKNLMNYKYCQLSTKKQSIIYVVLACLIVASFVLFYMQMNPRSIFRLFILAFSILLLINYIYFFHPQSKYKYIIIALIILELGVNTFASVKQNCKVESSSTVTYDLLSKKQINASLKVIKKDKSFYRTELTQRYSYNDGLLFSYNGINYFNSVRNQKVIDALEYNFPFEVGSHQSIDMNQLDPYLLALFDVKYLISDRDISYLEKIDDKVYLNKQALGLGFMVDKDVLNIKFKKKDYLNNISLVFSKMLKENLNLYKKIEDTKISLENVKFNKKTGKYENINNDAGRIIIEFTVPDNLLLSVKDQIGIDYYINEEIQTLNSSYLAVHSGDKIKIIMQFANQKENKDYTDIYYLDTNLYQTITDKLKANALQNIKVNNKHLLEASINVQDKDKLLFTSIPYEKGMIIKVNGKKVKPKLIFDAFIGLELEKGDNTIIIDYIPQGFILGIICSIFGITILVIKNTFKPKSKKSILHNLYSLN